jgi:multicomponent K+:H+ antiporter subunit D
VLVAGVLASSLLIVVTLSLNGSTLFWKPVPAGSAAAVPTTARRAATRGASAALGPEDCLPTRAPHRLALALLVALLLAAALFAGPLTRYAAGTAAQLFTPQLYRQAVLSARPAAPAWDVRREMRERQRAQPSGKEGSKP